MVNQGITAAMAGFLTRRRRKAKEVGAGIS